MIITRLLSLSQIPPPVKASLDIPWGSLHEVVYGSPWQVGRHHLHLLVSRCCNFFHKPKRHLQLLASRSFRNRKTCSKQYLDIWIMFSWHPPLFFSLPGTTNQPTTTNPPAMGGPDIAHQGQIIASCKLDCFTEGQKPSALQQPAVGQWGTGEINDCHKGCYGFDRAIQEM